MSFGTRPAPMNVAFERPSILQRIVPIFTGFDGPLMLAILLLAAAGLVTMYSAGFDSGTRFVDHGRNMMLALAVLFIVSQVPPQKLQQLAVPLYVAGVVLLVITALPGVGITKKGATRWLSIGVTQIQPSEILKIAMPLMLAWWFQKREGQLRVADFVIAALLLLVPVALVAKQPDLGTATLIMASGFFVLFLAGLPWKVMITGAVAFGASLPFVWNMLHDYQRKRVLVFLDPESDPLGSGYHITQSKIAIGSGGLFGKGFGNGSQSHLDYLPESHTDFAFATMAEEWGLLGGLFVLAVFMWTFRWGLQVARNAPDRFSMLLAAGE